MVTLAKSPFSSCILSLTHPNPKLKKEPCFEMVNNKCSVPYCPVAAAGLEKRGKGRGNVTHFSFPKDPELQIQWIEAIRRENFTPTTSSRVCEIHFNLEDFIPPKNPGKLHVVKRLREHCMPTNHLGDGGGLEQVTQSVVNIPGVGMETVVTDGTVQYETIEQGITLRPPDVEQTIQIAEANVETIIVKMEGDPSSETVETVEQAEVEHIKKLQPVNRTKNEIKEDIVPQEVLESTMHVENGYFERFIVKRKYKVHSYSLYFKLCHLTREIKSQSTNKKSFIFTVFSNDSQIMPVGNLSQVNRTSCSLILSPLVSRILFRCLIFSCYNISICKKGKVKDETSKKIRETNGGQIKEQDIPLT